MNRRFRRPPRVRAIFEPLEPGLWRAHFLRGRDREHFEDLGSVDGSWKEVRAELERRRTATFVRTAHRR